MTRWAALWLAFAGCRHAAELKEPAASPPAWCFQAHGRLHGAPIVGSGCFETYPICEHARGMARRYGPLGGISGVGQCGRVTK